MKKDNGCVCLDGYEYKESTKNCEKKSSHTVVIVLAVVGSVIVLVVIVIIIWKYNKVKKIKEIQRSEGLIEDSIGDN